MGGGNRMGQSGASGIEPVTTEEKEMIRDAHANGDGIALHEGSFEMSVTDPSGREVIAGQEASTRVIYQVDSNTEISRVHVTVSGSGLGNQHVQDDLAFPPGAEPPLSDFDPEVYHAYVKTNGSFASTTDNSGQAPLTGIPGGPPVPAGYTVDTAVQSRIEVQLPPGPK